MSSIFGYAGFTTPGFSYVSIESAKQQFQAIKAAGGNSIVLDYSLQNGSLTSNTVAIDRYSFTLDTLYGLFSAGKY